MPRYVYVTESVGEESGLDIVFSSPGKAVQRLRDHWAVSLPRGSVSRLKAGEIVWAEINDAYVGCARRMEVY